MTASACWSADARTRQRPGIWDCLPPPLRPLRRSRKPRGDRTGGSAAPLSDREERDDPGNRDQGGRRRAGDPLPARRQEERLHRPDVQRHVGGARRGRDQRRHRGPRVHRLGRRVLRRQRHQRFPAPRPGHRRGRRQGHPGALARLHPPPAQGDEADDRRRRRSRHRRRHHHAAALRPGLRHARRQPAHAVPRSRPDPGGRLQPSPRPRAWAIRAPSS